MTKMSDSKVQVSAILISTLKCLDINVISDMGIAKGKGYVVARNNNFSNLLLFKNQSEHKKYHDLEKGIITVNVEPI
jgi:hypothetical protein